jgi:hypothetical protein
MLVSTDADVIDADDIGHFLQPFDILSQAREEVPDADRAARLRDRTRVILADLPPSQRRGAHRSRSEQRRVREQQGFGCHLGRLFDRLLGRMRDVAHHTEPMTGLDRLGAKRREPIVHHRARLKVADIIRRVVQELRVPAAALVSLLKLQGEGYVSALMFDRFELDDGIHPHDRDASP